MLANPVKTRFSKRMDNSEYFVFANGIKLFRSDVSKEQAERYAVTSPLFHEPTEERWFECIFDLIESDQSAGRQPVFLDVGAALGYYSILFKRRFPNSRLIAVDPDPHFQQRMAETFQLNGFNAEDYTQIPFAIYPHGKQVVFAKRGFGSYIAQGEAIGQGKTADTMVIDVCRLSSVLGTIEGRIDLAKLDIQGAELAVFNHNSDLIDSGKVKYWTVGTHGPKIHQSILEHLSRKYEILYEDPSPEDQIDGLIVASYLDEGG